MKRILAYAAAYVLAAASIFLFLNPMWMKDYPEVQLFEGELHFSGERAYKDLEDFTSLYPERVVGSENARASAAWVEEGFKKLGFTTKIEEFDCSMPMMEAPETPKSPLAFSMEDFSTEVKGLNVIGTRPGKQKDIILIGAHRDIFGSKYGAEDNGSGTVTMLELARVLTEHDDQYTYMFVSFDGEEIGLFGSEDFARRHSDLPIKLAVVLDMTGYKDADTIGFYQYATSKGASPLWAMVLGKKLLASQGMEPYYFGEETISSLGSFSLFNKLMDQRVSGYVNTDSGPFVDRNMAAVGIMAARKDEDLTGFGSEGRIIHRVGDEIKQISPDTLDRVGKFTERYIHSAVLNQWKGALDSSWYLIAKDRFLGSGYLAAFIWVFSLAVLLLLVLTWRSADMSVDRFMRFLREERGWLLWILLLAAFVGGFWPLQGVAPFSSLPILLMGFLWFILSLGGTVTLLVLRFLWFRKRAVSYQEVTQGQRLLLNGVYTLLFLVMAVFYNPFVAVYIMALPILLMGRAGFGSIASRVIWIVVFALWSIAQIVMAVKGIMGYAFSMGSAGFAGFLFIQVLLWLVTFIYVVSAPGRRQAVEQHSSFDIVN